METNYNVMIKENKKYMGSLCLCLCSAQNRKGKVSEGDGQGEGDESFIIPQFYSFSFV
jgi:hypothetical protein